MKPYGTQREVVQKFERVTFLFMYFNENFAKINENKVVCTWKFEKKWLKLEKKQEKHSNFSG